jgi:hypothetical protein
MGSSRNENIVIGTANKYKRYAKEVEDLEEPVTKKKD